MTDRRCVAPPDPLLVLPSRLVFQLGKVARRLNEQMFPDDALRFPRVVVLACLAANGPLSQREVSERIDIDPGDLVGVIDALEKLGYVIRERDPRDRRRYALELTEAGRQALHERRKCAVRMNDALFAPLTRDEREQLEHLLLRVLAHHDERFAEIPSPAELLLRQITQARQQAAEHPDDDERHSPSRSR